VKTRCS